MPGKRNRNFLILKILVSVAALVYVFFRLKSDALHNGLIQTPLDVILGMREGNAFLILISVCLLPVNLGIEALKWKWLIRDYYPDLSFTRAVKAVTTGMSFGILTPNRLGDYAGRILFLEEGFRVEAALFTFVDRLSQMAATLIGGFFFLYFMDQFISFQGSSWENYEYEFKIAAVLLFPITLIFLFWPAIWMKPLLWLAGKFPVLKMNPGSMRPVPFSKAAGAMALSLLRYAVFSFQYVLLLKAYGFSLGIATAFHLIAGIFLIKSVIPFVGLSELGIREAVAVEMIAFYGIDSAVAFHPTVLLYLVNILLPALVGLVFLAQLKLKSGKGES